MTEKWIGRENDTSGRYYQVKEYDELSKRYGGKIDAIPLYVFKSRFGKEYNITDPDVIVEIELLLDEGEHTPKMYEYLYQLVINKFGMLEFLQDIEHRVSREREEGYKKGKFHMQRELRNLLGIK